MRSHSWPQVHNQEKSAANWLSPMLMLDKRKSLPPKAWLDLENEGEPESQAGSEWCFSRGGNNFVPPLSPLPTILIDTYSWNTRQSTGQSSCLRELVYSPSTSVVYQDTITCGSFKSDFIFHPFHSTQYWQTTQRWSAKRTSKWVISPFSKTVTDRDDRRIEILHVWHSSLKDNFLHIYHLRVEKLCISLSSAGSVSQQFPWPRISLWNVSGHLLASSVLMRFVMSPQTLHAPWCVRE